MSAKVHYLEFGSRGRPRLRCGLDYAAGGYSLTTTTDRADVSCGNCRRMLEPGARVGVGPVALHGPTPEHLRLRRVRSRVPDWFGGNAGRTPGV